MVEAAGNCGAPVVFTSTGGALYGDEAPMPTPEDRIPAPLSPYGASKWAAEAYVNTWSLSSGIPHAVCRLGNVYGPRQSPHGEAGVVAIFTDHLYTGKTPTLYGHGKPTRDYVYVGDVVSALLAASGKSGTYNVATGVETDVMGIWREPQRRPPGSRSSPSSPTCAPASCSTAASTPRRAEDRARLASAGADRRGAGARPTRSLVEEFERSSSRPALQFDSARSWEGATPWSRQTHEISSAGPSSAALTSAALLLRRRQPPWPSQANPAARSAPASEVGRQRVRRAGQRHADRS